MAVGIISVVVREIHSAVRKFFYEFYKAPEMASPTQFVLMEIESDL